MERLRLRSTSLLDTQAELRQRDLLAEAQTRRWALDAHPLGRTGLPGLRIIVRRILG